MPKKIPHVEAERIRSQRGRTYRIAGLGDFPSVTTVLSVIEKPALIGWAKKVAIEKVREELRDHVVEPGNLDTFDQEQRLTAGWVNDMLEEAIARPDTIRDDAADLGIRAHKAIQGVLAGKARPDDSEISVILDGFDAWRERVGIEVEIAERTVYSREYWYAGTVDAVAWIKVGSRWRAIVIDWKTSLGIYPEAACQVVAYGRAIEEMTGVKVHEHWVVRFGKPRDTMGRPTGEPPQFEAVMIHETAGAFAAFLAARDLWDHYSGSWRWWGQRHIWKGAEEGKVTDG